MRHPFGPRTGIVEVQVSRDECSNVKTKQDWML